MIRILLSITVAMALLVGCNNLPESEDPPIIEGLPDMEDIADSLNKAQIQSLKWSVTKSDSIVYALPQNVDWKKEFQAFLKDDVNRLRYQEAYSVSDVTQGNRRIVVFTANKKKQEIRHVKIHVLSGSVVYYEILKERDNLFSSSRQLFVFDQNHYQLEIDQSIEWLFDNEQFVYGSLLPPGEVWRGLFTTGTAGVPVQMVLNPDSLLVVKNGDGRSVFTFSGNKGDSSVYTSTYFNAYFVLSQTDDHHINGRWVNAKRDVSHSLSFTATKNQYQRFNAHVAPTLNLSGKHLVTFINETGDNDSSLLVLNQVKHHVQGSFLTATGDYRYLEGVVRNDSLLLSSMDGTHAYLFTASIKDGELNGVFRAGKTWQQKWKATLNQTVELRDPESITQLKTDSSFTFRFSDVHGQAMGLTDPYFKGKPVLVSIMGTWCSNCLDESIFLSEIQNQYATEDLAIVALDYELVSDSATAMRNIEKYIATLGLEYPVLLASLGSSKTKASTTLPSLNGIYSYPTLIVLDKTHDVVRIHTGFSGPATGPEFYGTFKESYIALIDSLIKA